MSDPSRLLPVAVALCLGLSPLGAAATSALFHFDDFDYDYDYQGDPDAPYTYAYGCEGKPYCTAREVFETKGDGDGSSYAERVSTMRNGIGLEIGRYGNVWTMNYDADAGWVDVGNDPSDFTLFLLDFDTPLRSFSADIPRPRVLERDYCDDLNCQERDVYSLVQVYLWSGLGGQGDLVGSLTITPDDVFAGRVSLLTDQPFRSVNFGQAVSEDPNCIVGDLLPCGQYSLQNGHWTNFYAIGNILVDTVPEPSTALLIGLGLVGLTARSRSRGAR